MIKGMGCAACANRIERGLGDLEGVEKVSVNLLTNSMKIEFDSDKLTSSEIIEEVDGLGYEAEEFAENNGGGAEDGDTDELDIGSGESPESRREAIYAAEEKGLRKRLIVSAVFEIPLFVLSMFHGMAELFPSHEAYIIAQMCLLMPIVLINFKIYRVGIPMLFKGSPNMDSLVAVGTIASFPLGYFDSVGMILTLVTLGKWLESRAKSRTTDAIKGLMKLAPDKVTVIRDGDELVVPSAAVRVGETVKVRPGETIGVDGVIVKGQTSINQAAITGESFPVERTVGEKVMGGTINIDGTIQIKATEVGRDTVLSKVIEIVEEASSGKAPISRIADKVSGIFVPIVIGIAILTVAIWTIVFLLKGEPIDWNHALVCGISVLVISCPCALGLATPVAVMVGTGRGAGEGIIIKSTAALENLGKVDVVVFDKTGTITEGNLSVTDVVSMSDLSSDRVAEIAASIEADSEHPIGKAICAYGKERGLKTEETADFSYSFGKGITCSLADNPLKKYFAGNGKLLKEATSLAKDLETGKKDIENLQSQGKTTVILADEERILGIIALADKPKSGAAETVKAIKNLGKETVLLTGDNHVTGNAVGRAVGVDAVIAEVLPQDKDEVIRKYRERGKKVAMVGDGVNDAPAIVRADVGIAVGNGTNVAIDAADVVLMSEDISKVEKAIDLSIATVKTIKSGLFWAFFYNIVCIPMAAGVLYPSLGILLDPMIAAGAMSLSSVSVVTNALRLRKRKL